MNATEASESEVDNEGWEVFESKAESSAGAGQSLKDLVGDFIWQFERHLESLGVETDDVSVVLTGGQGFDGDTRIAYISAKWRRRGVECRECGTEIPVAAGASVFCGDCLSKQEAEAEESSAPDGPKDMIGFYKMKKNTGHRRTRYANNAHDAFEHCANDDTVWPEGVEAYIGDCITEGDYTITKITEAEYDAA